MASNEYIYYEQLSESSSARNGSFHVTQIHWILNMRVSQKQIIMAFYSVGVFRFVSLRH